MGGEQELLLKVDYLLSHMRYWLNESDNFHVLTGNPLHLKLTWLIICIPGFLNHSVWLTFDIHCIWVSFVMEYLGNWRIYDHKHVTG